MIALIALVVLGLYGLDKQRAKMHEIYRAELPKQKPMYRLAAKPSKRLSFNDWAANFPQPDPSKINLN